MTQVFWYEQTVHFGDVDLGGVLYHARYLDYFDRARIEALSELGCPFHEILKSGSALVVASANLNYKKPVGFGQRVGISTRVASVSSKSAVVRQTLIADPKSNSIGDAAVCAELEVVLVNIELKKRESVPLAEHFASLLRGAV